MPSSVADMAAFKRRRFGADAGNEPQLPLYGGGDGGGNMDPTVAMKEYIDARDDAVESRLGAKLDKLPSIAQMWSAVGVLVATLISLLGLVFALMAFGSDRFNGGLSVSPVVAQMQAGQKRVDETQDAKLEMMDRKLDILVERSAKR